MDNIQGSADAGPVPRSDRHSAYPRQCQQLSIPAHSPAHTVNTTTRNAVPYHHRISPANLLPTALHNVHIRHRLLSEFTVRHVGGKKTAKGSGQIIITNSFKDISSCRP
jgi:hypothetical protein